MKLSHYPLVTILLIGHLIMTPLSTADDEDLEDYLSECSAPMALYDPAVMAETMTTPSKFMSFIMEMRKSATVNAIAECVVHPEQWSSVAIRITDYNNYAQAMTIFMSPQIYMNWMTATMK